MLALPCILGPLYNYIASYVGTGLLCLFFTYYIFYAAVTILCLTAYVIKYSPIYSMYQLFDILTAHVLMWFAGKLQNGASVFSTCTHCIHLSYDQLVATQGWIHGNVIGDDFLLNHIWEAKNYVLHTKITLFLVSLSCH